MASIIIQNTIIPAYLFKFRLKKRCEATVAINSYVWVSCAKNAFYCIFLSIRISVIFWTSGIHANFLRFHKKNSNENRDDNEMVSKKFNIRNFLLQIHKNVSLIFLTKSILMKLMSCEYNFIFIGSTKGYLSVSMQQYIVVVQCCLNICVIL